MGRRRREPIRRCGRRKCELKAAGAKKQHIRVANMVLYGRFQVKIEGSVLIVGIMRPLAIREVLVGVVPVGLAGKDGTGSKLVSIGNESSEQNDGYIDHYTACKEALPCFSRFFGRRTQTQCGFNHRYSLSKSL